MCPVGNQAPVWSTARVRGNVCGVLCGVVWCGVVWCGVVLCGVVWCVVCVWCGMCGGVWCGVCVVWCTEYRVVYFREITYQQSRAKHIIHYNT